MAKTCKRIVVESGERRKNRMKWHRAGPAISVSAFRRMNREGGGVSLRGLKPGKWLVLNMGAGGLFRVRCSR